MAIQGEEVLPAVFGKYRLVKRIATGGMAEIFLAHRRDSPAQPLVIKRILPHLVTSQEFVSMFLDEARIAAQLHHENIVHIQDVGQVEGSYFIAMEYVRGEDIRRIYNAAYRLQRSLPLSHSIRVIADAALGLGYAHKLADFAGHPLGVVHRDVSPQNILVTYEGAVKVVDFGIAKAANKVNQTRAGVLKGKYSYMSPEQALGEHIDHRTDIFALGIILYETTTGTRLFKRHSELATLQAIIKCEFVLPSEALPGYPVELEEILLRALAKRPEDRWRDAQEFSAALYDFLHTSGLYVEREAIAEFMADLFQDRVEEEQAGGGAAAFPPAHELREEMAPAPARAATSSNRRRIEHDPNRTLPEADEEDIAGAPGASLADEPIDGEAVRAAEGSPETALGPILEGLEDPGPWAHAADDLEEAGYAVRAYRSGPAQAAPREDRETSAERDRTRERAHGMAQAARRSRAAGAVGSADSEVRTDRDAAGDDPEVVRALEAMAAAALGRPSRDAPEPSGRREAHGEAARSGRGDAAAGGARGHLRAEPAPNGTHHAAAAGDGDPLPEDAVRMMPKVSEGAAPAAEPGASALVRSVARPGAAKPGAGVEPAEKERRPARGPSPEAEAGPGSVGARPGGTGARPGAKSRRNRRGPVITPLGMGATHLLGAAAGGSSDLVPTIAAQPVFGEHAAYASMTLAADERAFLISARPPPRAADGGTQRVRKRNGLRRWGRSAMPRDVAIIGGRWPRGVRIVAGVLAIVGAMLAGAFASRFVGAEHGRGAPATHAGRVTVLTEPGAFVFANGDRLGAANADGLAGPYAVAAGLTELRVALDDVGFERIRRLAVEPDRIHEFEIRGRRGSLKVQAQPWARVKVDGQDVGMTPLSPLPLLEGWHRVVLENSGIKRRYATRVKIDAFGSAELKVNLADSGTPD